jgi:hypothetical protein
MAHLTALHKHFEQTLTGSLELAADEDPNEPA